MFFGRKLYYSNAFLLISSNSTEWHAGQTWPLVKVIFVCMLTFTETRNRDYRLFYKNNLELYLVWKNDFFSLKINIIEPWILKNTHLEFLSKLTTLLINHFFSFTQINRYFMKKGLYLLPCVNNYKLQFYNFLDEFWKSLISVNLIEYIFFN